ncbi:hypothetical protein Cgig2_024840 [Carnegiea gigantea]|uniref:Uncharacterized protein n=1 Tax=Carnegiea gigantea TaxID=171969 RepID=A0A9Q1QG94_9CARY|nr:hypothetical protein Cgig2_024840 [Carnegiea gigantea]
MGFSTMMMINNDPSRRIMFPPPLPLDHHQFSSTPSPTMLNLHPSSATGSNVDTCTGKKRGAEDHHHDPDKDEEEGGDQEELDLGRVYPGHGSGHGPTSSAMWALPTSGSGGSTTMASGLHFMNFGTPMAYLPGQPVVGPTGGGGGFDGQFSMLAALNGLRPGAVAGAIGSSSQGDFARFNPNGPH